MRKYTPNEEIQDIEVQEKDYESDPDAISDTDTLDDHIPEHAQIRANYEENPREEPTQETEIDEEVENHVTLLSDSEDEIAPLPQRTPTKVRFQNKPVIVSGNNQTHNGTQPPVTTPASESQSSQSIPPQRNIEQQTTTEPQVAQPTVEQRQPVIINSPREEQQQVQNVPTAEHQTQIPTRIVPKENHSRDDLRRVTRAMTNTQNTRSTRTRYDLRDNPPKKTFADSLLSQMSIKDTSKLARFFQRQ